MFQGKGFTNFTAAQTVSTLINGNGGEPGFEGGCALEVGQTLVDLQKGILNDVLGFGIITQDCVSQIVDVALVLGDKLVEGSFIAFLNNALLGRFRCSYILISCI